jgi:hypothetical protein
MVEVKKVSQDVQEIMPLVKKAAEEITNHNNDLEINHFQSSMLNCWCESNSNVG